MCSVTLACSLRTLGMVSKICGIGAGYVGGCTLSVIAHHCPKIQVTVVDISENIIEQWNSDILPIYEPGLEDIVKAVRGKNLFFSTDIDKAIDEAELIFISVDTPTKKYGIGQGRAPNMANLEAAARKVANVSRSPKVVVEKSTVPIKASETIASILNSAGRANGWNRLSDGDAKSSGLQRSVVLSNPEFLAEGTAVENLMHPDRVLIGGDEASDCGRLAIEMLRSIYLHWVDAGRILVMSTWSSELSKLAANAFLAQRISSINAISAICEKTGADIRDVARAIGSDTRIGPHFLKASLGFGGSCFRKDILNLVYISECLNLNEVASYWYSVLQMNEFQHSRFCRQIISKFNNTLTGKRIAIFGFSFKADTHDTRESQAILVCNSLLEERAIVAIYDPKALPHQIRSDLLSLQHADVVDKQVVVCSTALEAVKGAYAIVICTEWEEFKHMDYNKFFTSMKKPPRLFDGRVLLNHEDLMRIGFEVESIGVDMSKIVLNGH
ncbi:UDP-glucose 6-dehydrogenase [Clonorchis sinensis]|uniref:UDP-glucose 6-dehydrogenase n=3 Tax=Clonorchis sinensis TaxID=79923 RepID=A0A8T1M7H3_CLOSI|nr:UDP-glucose 6-dehydrogenase [Clonorchis sinensis]